MIETPEPFEFNYSATGIVYGRGCVAGLGEVLDIHGFERAMVVTGSNVGANGEVMGPIEEALDDRLVAIYDETTPNKNLETVLDGVDLMADRDVDVLVGVGGGSSLNVTRAMCAIAPLGWSRERVIEEVVATRDVPSPEAEEALISNVVVPTTMAGADVSGGGTVFVDDAALAPEATGSGRIDATVSDPRLVAEANLFDPTLFATTPTEPLVSSAMNGFDKGIETLYSRESTPIANAHAIKALQHYRVSLPNLAEADADGSAYDHAVLATVLVQYGRKTNIIHTFGNGISLHYDVQQGAVHSIVVPYVLQYVFDTAHAHRHRIAEGLSIEVEGMDDDAVAEAIIEEVIFVRDALGLPRRLRMIDGMERDHFDAVAKEILDNHKHARNPHGIDPTVEDVVAILEAAW
jgi:alcohol dehydrogenase class IV